MPGQPTPDPTSAGPADAGPAAKPSWTFLTNHGHVLLGVAADPHVRLRDLAARVGITTRAVQLILADLEQAGYLRRTRTGRRNHYTLCPDLPLRHPAESDHAVGELLAVFSGPRSGRPH